MLGEHSLRQLSQAPRHPPASADRMMERPPRRLWLDPSALLCYSLLFISTVYITSNLRTDQPSAFRLQANLGVLGLWGCGVVHEYAASACESEQQRGMISLCLGYLTLSQQHKHEHDLRLF